MFWKSKNEENKKINSEEYETLFNKCVELSGVCTVLDNKYQILLGSLRKLNLKVSKLLKEQLDDEEEKNLKDSPLHI